MKTIALEQGTPQWAAHRAAHFNASDAPAMLGISPYKTRAALLREVATGIREDVDAATQRRFDDGHRFEALARPLAEQIIGEELYPCTGVLEGSKFSASFDGLTLLEDTAFEHKTLNDVLRGLADLAGGVLDGDLLPEHYRAQMEQQCLVSGAPRVLFMASKWDGETLVSERHGWYKPDAELRARIIAGWEQFGRDLANYTPEPVAAPAPVAAPVEGFGVLSLRVEGRVLASNLDAFRADADAFLARLPKASELETDQDFADAEAAVKACTEAEARIKAAKDAALAQMADVDAVMRAADSVAETIRAARLALDKVVKAEKENRRAMTVAHYVKLVGEHIAAINKTLGEFAISAPPGLSHDIASAAKGKRTIMSIVDACDQAAAVAKIVVSHKAETIRQNIAVLAEHDAHAGLFADRVSLAHSKHPNDLRLLVAARIAEHQQREAARLEAERESIRREEEVKAQAEAFDKLNSTEERLKHSDPILAGVAQSVEHLPSKQGVAGSTPAARSTIRLGEIVAAIAPLSITAEGLAQLGFPPVGQERAAKLYDARDFYRIRDAMIELLRDADIGEAVSVRGAA